MTYVNKELHSEIKNLPLAIECLMKKTGFLLIFISTHVVFVFLQIHQYSHIINSSYQKQKTEKLKEQLLQKKQSLTHQLYALQNKTAVKNFAQNKLGMEPIHLHQIQKLNGYSNVTNKTV